MLKVNSVCTKEKIPKGTRFGPYQGNGDKGDIILPDALNLDQTSHFHLKIFNEDGSTTRIHTWDENTCNWMCLVPAAQFDDEQNLIAYQVQQDVYFGARRDIKAREELRVWYAPNYCRKMGAHCLPKRSIAPNCEDPPFGKKRRGRPRVVRPETNVQGPEFVCETIYSVQPETLDTRTTRKRKTRTDSDYIYYEKSTGPSVKESSPESDRFDKILEEMAKNEPSQDEFVPVKKRGWKKGRKRKPVEEDKRSPVLNEHAEVLPTTSLETPNPEFIEDMGAPEVLEAEVTDNKWACSRCRKAYQDCIEFAFHLRAHFKPRQIHQPARRKWRFPCPFCYSVFRSPNQLYHHKVRFHGDTMRAVRKCGLARYDTRGDRISAITDVLRQSRKSAYGRKTTNISDVDAASILLQIEANAEKLEISSAVSSVIIEIPSDNVVTVSEKLPVTGGKYSCDICQRSFARRLNLFRHLRQHTGNFKCATCLGVFVSGEILEKHSCLGRIVPDREAESFETNTRSVERGGENLTRQDTLSGVQRSSHDKYECEICHKTFSKMKYLDKHIPVHTGAFTCPICGKWLRSRDSLTNHMRICGQVSELETKGLATCPNCRAEFTDVRQFRRHMYEHSHQFACQVCGARFRNRLGLTVHVCKSERTLKCDTCDETFQNVTEFNIHKISHFEQSDSKCKKCGKEFEEKSQLESHACKRRANRRGPRGPRKAVGLSPLVCDICGSMFSSTSSLNVHRNLHGEKRFGCQVCGKRFHRKDLMLEHSAVHGAPQVPCPICDKMFKTKKSLDVHLLIHDGTKRFSCATCGKQFYQKGNLLKHEETHNPGRRYNCEYCNKAFGTKEYLAIHVLEHTRGRIYQCQLCEKSFVKEHQLKAHQRIFHSNVAYVCKYCGLTVKLRHSLKRHLEKKHADRRHEWDVGSSVCGMLVSNEESEITSATKNLVNAEEPAIEASMDIGDISSMQEVLLAVAGIDSAALQQALAAGTARIKQGPTPGTIEISLPMADDGTETYAQVDGDYTLRAHVIQVPVDASQEAKELEESVGFQFAVNQCDLDAEQMIVVGDQEGVVSAGELQVENGTIVVEGGDELDSSGNVLLYVMTTDEAENLSTEQTFESS